MCKTKDCPNERVHADGLCLYCYKWGADKPPKEKKVYVMPKVSAKEKARQKEYKPVRDLYLKEHPVCEIRLTGCKVVAKEIHHTMGKIGDLLTDTSHFKATCQPCHRIVEDSPEMAKEQGHSKSRLKITKS